MSYLGVRGAEASVEWQVEGSDLKGSFTTCKSFEFTPRATIDEVEILGDTLDEHSFIHTGWDGTFKYDEMDPVILDLYLKCAAASENHLPHPVINVVVRTKYKSPKVPSRTLLARRVSFKLDSNGASGKKAFKNNDVSVKFRQLIPVT